MLAMMKKHLEERRHHHHHSHSPEDQTILRNFSHESPAAAENWQIAIQTAAILAPRTAWVEVVEMAKVKIQILIR